MVDAEGKFSCIIMEFDVDTEYCLYTQITCFIQGGTSSASLTIRLLNFEMLDTCDLKYNLYVAKIVRTICRVRIPCRGGI
jgi:hypothetical protein